MFRCVGVDLNFAGATEGNNKYNVLKYIPVTMLGLDLVGPRNNYFQNIIIFLATPAQLHQDLLLSYKF